MIRFFYEEKYFLKGEHAWPFISLPNLPWAGFRCTKNSILLTSFDGWLERWIGTAYARPLNPTTKPGADVIFLSRVELTDENRLRIPSLREYARFFCLTKRRLALAAEDAIVLHSGSMNRGVEISPEVADAAFPLMVQQVTNGIAFRMAVLYLLAGGRE